MTELSPRSEKSLVGVNPRLVDVVRRAKEISEVDFIVIEGLRTKARQAELVAKGASTTLNSRHITGHAVDIVPVIGGEIRWDWPLYYKLAEAMKQAAIELGVKVVWGGVWDCGLEALGDLEEDVTSYVARRKVTSTELFITSL